ncbi:MAG: DUF58 domain-containing protein [Alphaproteobacteria bacterium]|nr:MAG: DUF58 domain-containing protein [Alphaproteobacteria bacterium]
MPAQLTAEAMAPAVDVGACARLFQHARALARRILIRQQRGEVTTRFERGVHPRRRKGAGDSFWQYRPFESGEPARLVDWRRSARSDRLYVREHEWETNRVLWLWVDRSTRMRFASRSGLPSKEARALLIGFTAAWMAWESGELAGWLDDRRYGAVTRSAARRLLAAASHDSSSDLQALGQLPLRPGSRLLVVSDGLWPVERLAACLDRWRRRGLRAMVVTLVDPAEERFPYSGRLLLEATGDEDVRLLVEDGEAAAEAIDRQLAAHHQAVTSLLAGAGVPHLRLATATGEEASAALLAGLLPW